MRAAAVATFLTFSLVKTGLGFEYHSRAFQASYLEIVDPRYPALEDAEISKVLTTASRYFRSTFYENIAFIPTERIELEPALERIEESEYITAINTHCYPAAVVNLNATSWDTLTSWFAENDLSLDYWRSRHSIPSSLPDVPKGRQALTRYILKLYFDNITSLRDKIDVTKANRSSWLSCISFWVPLLYSVDFVLTNIPIIYDQVWFSNAIFEGGLEWEAGRFFSYYNQRRPAAGKDETAVRLAHFLGHVLFEAKHYQGISANHCLMQLPFVERALFEGPLLFQERRQSCPESELANITMNLAIGVHLASMGGEKKAKWIIGDTLEERSIQPDSLVVLTRLALDKKLSDVFLAWIVSQAGEQLKQADRNFDSSDAYGATRTIYRLIEAYKGSDAASRLLDVLKENSPSTEEDRMRQEGKVDSRKASG